MKLVVVASVLDISLPFGCTPAWWQLLKALHENGAEVVATPYYGRPVESLWWRVYDNPCYRLGKAFAALCRVRRMLPLGTKAAANGRETRSQQAQRVLINKLIKPRWRKHLFSILKKEKNVAAVLILTVPLNHLGGIPSAIRQEFGVPVCYFDGDLPASLPQFGGFASGFNSYRGADVSEYDAILSNSQGSLDMLQQLGARRTEVLWWGADPGVFRPIPADEDIDVFFYGLGTEYRQEWLRDMIAIPSQRLPQLRFVAAGANLDIDLGRAERVGLIPPAQLSHYVTRARINLNVARSAHASVYASATTRLFELAAMEQAIVTNPLKGLHEWFEPGREIEVVHDANEAVATYRRLIEDAGHRQDLARAARERVLRQHTYDHRAKQLLRFLESLTSQGARAATVPVPAGVEGA